MKKILTLVIIVSGYSCTFKGNCFFDFDEVIHYSKDLTEQEIMDLESGTEHKQTEDDKKVFTIIHNDGCDLSDKTFFETLEKNFLKKPIDKKYYDRLRKEVFVATGKAVTEFKACIAEYRDVLVFKKNGKVTGIAKICFHCQQYSFAGDSFFGSDSFGAGDEFDKLLAIVLENSGIKVGDYVFQFPHDFKLIKDIGIDSYVGRVQGDSMTMSFDFGRYSNTLSEEKDSLIIKIDTVDNQYRKLVYTNDTQNGITGIYIRPLDSDLALSMTTSHLTKRQQEIALGIFSTSRHIDK